MTERVAKKAKATTLLGLSGQLWVELILKPHITTNIYDCIALKRTCSFFASLSAVQEWIKTFEREMFGEFDRIHWNKLALHNSPTYMNLNKHQYFISYRIGYNLYRDVLDHVGLYSDKKRLWVAFNRIINLDVLLEDPHYNHSFKDEYIYIFLVRNNQHTPETIIVSNAIKEDYEHIISLYHQYKK